MKNVKPVQTIAPNAQEPPQIAQLAHQLHKEDIYTIMLVGLTALLDMHKIPF
jgi:hypothetical protein